MQIYNAKFMNNKQRFYRAILFGILTAIGCSLIFSAFVSTTHIRFSIFYLLTGYFIAKVINETSHGIGKKYSYLGAGLTFFSAVLTEIFIYLGYSILFEPQLWGMGIRFVLSVWSQMNASNLMTIFFMVWGIYIAYTSSNGI